MEWGWLLGWIGQLVVVVVGSGLSATVVSLFFEHRRHKRQRADEEEYLAIQLAFLFEDYGLKAADAISDNQLYDSHAGNAGHQITSVPDAPALPDSNSYKLLDRKLLHGILEFAQRRDLAQREAMFYWNVADYDRDEMAVEMASRTAQIGLRAFEISENLRRNYRLTKRDLSAGKWDPRDYLRQHVRNTAASKQRTAASAARRIPTPIDGSDAA